MSSWSKKICNGQKTEKSVLMASTRPEWLIREGACRIRAESFSPLCFWIVKQENSRARLPTGQKNRRPLQFFLVSTSFLPYQPHSYLLPSFWPSSIYSVSRSANFSLISSAAILLPVMLKKAALTRCHIPSISLPINSERAWSSPKEKRSSSAREGMVLIV